MLEYISDMFYSFSIFLYQKMLNLKKNVCMYSWHGHVCVCGSEFNVSVFVPHFILYFLNQVLSLSLEITESDISVCQQWLQTNPLTQLSIWVLVSECSYSCLCKEH